MNTLTPEFIIAIGGFVTGLLGGILAIYTAKKSARRDEYMFLRDEVARLQTRVENLEIDYERERRNNVVLLDYIGLLRGLMVGAGIAVPKMPILE